MLIKLLQGEIARHGILPFHRFMERALYHHEYGYYRAGRHSIGKHGDFFTNVSVGPLFGELLALQLGHWLLGLNQQKAFQMVEIGANDGQLAADILAFVRNNPSLFPPNLEYWIIEPFARNADCQRQKLKDFGSTVRWFGDWMQMEPGTICGVIFANELLDAFPVHRLGWDAAAKKWFEWGVVQEMDGFGWAKMTHSYSAASEWVKQEAEASGFWMPDELMQVLPDGFTVDICPAAREWWKAAGLALRLGRLMTIDYGLNFEDFFTPERSNGTLRTYCQHQLATDPLKNPGERDMTASVNFSALLKTGEAMGLMTEFFGPQNRFLNGVASAHAGRFETPASQSAARLRQLKTLMHPEHLGRAFKVLVQAII